MWTAQQRKDVYAMLESRCGKAREMPSPPPPPPKQSAVPPPLPQRTVIVEVVPPPQVKEVPNVGDAIQALGGMLFHLVCIFVLVPVIVVMVGCLVSVF